MAIGVFGLGEETFSRLRAAVRLYNSMFLLCVFTFVLHFFVVVAAVVKLYLPLEPRRPVERAYARRPVVLRSRASLTA